jgi:hypothetical protein
MISILLYGRNDAHGYNLHRRAALSLNCLAEILTDPDDEILFVDYNTPDELPTFVEAIADTLTDRCLDLLRVLRVPAAVHAERFAGRTHLPALEPVARNVAARRARPSNRWLLSTNTDMIFLPLAGESLSEIASGLADGFYGLPRFELPEWLWEWLPRSDPQRVAAELSRLGPGLRLDEVTVSHQWIRFDAPGDFQLVLREDFYAINGFDEEMVLGWHVDSNFSRRMLFRRDSIGSLDGRLAGYHCNHSRTPTVYHGEATMNDLGRFFASVDRAELPAQAQRWGLANIELEEVRVRERLGALFPSALLAAIPEAAAASSDALSATFELTYDSGHVLSFLADSLAVAPAGTRIAYVGANPVLRRMLGTLVDGLAPRTSLAVADVRNPEAFEDIVRAADLIVVDLGVDSSLIDGSSVEANNFDPDDLPLAFEGLDQVVRIERARLEDGAHPRRIVLVNSSTFAVDPFVTSHLDSSATTIHSRVRRATVKPVPPQGRTATTAADLGRRLIRWSIRRALGPQPLVLRPGETRRIPDLPDYRAFGEGWAYPDEYGIWTRGERAELAVAFDGVQGRRCRLAFSIRAICLAPGDTLDVDLVANSKRVAGRRFPARHLQKWWVELPAAMVAHGRADLTLVVKNPRSPLLVGWSTDDSRLGILIPSVTLEAIRPSQAVTDRLQRAHLYVRTSVGFRRHLQRLRRTLRR